MAQGAPAVNIVTGQSLSIPCMLLDGIPLPERHWFQNEKPVRVTAVSLFKIHQPSMFLYEIISSSVQVQLNGRMFQRSDGSLFIEKAIPEDAGAYVCTAVNVAGSTNITVILEVHGKSSKTISRQFHSFLAW